MALSIIDELGLDALSLGLLAQRIGVRAPSLYHHFQDKAELLAGVAQRLLREIDISFRRDMSWEEQLIELCRITRRTILRHPNAASLLLRFFPRNIMLPAYEYWTGKCPYPPSIRLILMEGTEKLTFGSILFAAASSAYGVPAMPDVDAKTFPVVAEAIATMEDEETLFVATVRAFVEGLRGHRDGGPAG